MSSNGVQLDPAYQYNPNGSRAPVRRELDRDAFLKILMTQLQYQDPSEPLKDKDFIAQMAQFSSLEQMNKVSESMNMSYGAQLLGTTVTYKAKDGSLKTGEVTELKRVDGTVKIKVGSAYVNLSDVEAVAQKK